MGCLKYCDRMVNRVDPEHTALYEQSDLCLLGLLCHDSVSIF